MITFILSSKKENEFPNHVLTRDEEGNKASLLYSAVEEKFANYIVENSPESEPFIYITLSPIKEKGEKAIAGVVPVTCFKDEVLEDITQFVKEYN